MHFYSNTRLNSSGRFHVFLRIVKRTLFPKLRSPLFSLNLFFSVFTPEGTEETAVSGQKKRCAIRIENDDRVLDGRGELVVSVWATATAWGRYEDVVTVQLRVNDDDLPAVRVPITVVAVTFPIEFPLATGLRAPPTIK